MKRRQPVPKNNPASRLRGLLEELNLRFEAPEQARMDSVIVEAQRALVEKLGLDRSSLWQKKDRDGGLVMTHLWQKPGGPAVPTGIRANSNLPWAVEQIEKGRGFHFSRISDLPPEARRDRRTFLKYGPRSNVTVPLSAGGEVFGALAFASLETEHEWTEEELREIRVVAGVFSHILGQIRARAHLTEMRAELRRRSKLSLLGEFAASLVHEISQPLSAIRADAAAIRLGGADRGSEALAAIEENAERAGRILSNIRSMLRGETAEPRDVCVTRLVGDAVAVVRPELELRAVDVEVVIAPGLPAIRVAPDAILQVLVNLARNAVEAMAGQTIRRSMVIRGDCRGRRVRLVVEDNGPGIPRGMEEKIFAPLFTTRAGGTGMGLAICRRTLAAYGGTIRAGRRRGGGARIEFTLPAA